ncbi:YcgN family cysteine cluster protein [uncultured Algimonas sp.]|uniref:YcgN family cysteine cluster protein n=1 Tax=uncultured Algimonas sp. TaxID=1547920 RepID=UPI002617E1FF|nr:YcgN family cysteine cluster protein [uncultured Algimonas sp.]
MTDPQFPKPFWQTKPLADMSADEWESLCDGCGKCCLIRLEDEETGEVHNTDAHCKLFDSGSCECKDYVNRKAVVSDCVILKPANIKALKWMPRSCAYRLLSEGAELPEWHHLRTGSRDSIHEAGMSVRNATVTEEGLSEAALLSRITLWPGEPGWED